MIATLRQRNFALLWFGGLISMSGDWMLRIALPIYVYKLTGSTLATSAMFVAEMAPFLLFGSVAGVFVDRWDRKRTMVISNLLLALGILPLLLVRSAEWLWVVYVVAFCESCISQFFSPAENALLPRLVGEEHLIAANSLNSLNNNIARLVGPPLGGLVAGLAGLAGVALVDGASFLIAGVMIALITASGKVERETAMDAVEAAARSWTEVWREWLDGLRLIRSQRTITVLFITMAMMSLGEGVFGVMFVVWVSEVLSGGAREIGWLMGSQAIGGLIGGLVVGRIGNSISPPHLLGICSVLFGLFDLALFNYPLFLPGFALAVILIIIVGVPGVGVGAATNTLLQSGVRDEYRGRVFAALGTTGALLMLVGTTTAGAIEGVAGPITLLNIQGGAYVLAGLFALLTLRGAVDWSDWVREEAGV